MPLEYQAQQTSHATIPPCSEHMWQFLKNDPLFSHLIFSHSKKPFSSINNRTNN
jgi:hypothetical protein